MNRSLTSRRKFLKLASVSGVAVGSGAVALPGRATMAGAARSNTVRCADSAISIDFDARMHSSIAYVGSGRKTLLTRANASEFVELADGRRVSDFVLQHHTTEPVDGIHGKGSQFTLTGLAAAGLEKTVRVRLFDRYPGFAVVSGYLPEPLRAAPYASVMDQRCVPDSIPGRHVAAVLVVLRELVRRPPRLATARQTGFRAG